MFEVIDLSGRALHELKEIAKGFSIDSKGLAKGDIILKIVDAQIEQPELAKRLSEQFSKQNPVK